MKFLADQCTSMRTVRFLRSEGYSVITLEDLNQATSSDLNVLKLATARDEVLITEDKDFGNTVGSRKNRLGSFGADGLLNMGRTGRD